MATQQKPTEESEAAQVEDRIRALRARIDPMIAADAKLDGADATMSAIEEALNLTPQDLRGEAEQRRIDTLRLPKVDDSQDFAKRPLSADVGSDFPRRRVDLDPPPVSPSSRPANDDRRSVGQILQALQYRPSRTAQFIAAGMSAGWLAMVGVYALGARSVPLDQAAAAMLVLASVGPVAFFFMIATLTQRVQEMRHTARSMGEVAVRLADPDSFTTEQVMILSQAIRREIASMGDGVERALARAGELELMVHNEVSNLERSYADNERRMRALIDELSSEREAIVTNADRVRQSVTSAQEMISREVAQAGSRIAEQVNEAGVHVNALLGGHAEDITSQLRAAGEDMVSTLSSQGEGFIQKLMDTGDSITGRLFDSTKLFASTINDRAESVEQQLQICSNAIGDRIDAATARIADTISERGDGLISRFAETSERIHSSVIIQAQELADTLSSSGERISTMLAERTGNASEIFETSTQALIAHNKHLESLFDTRNRELEDLTERAREDLSNTLNATCQNISIMIGERTDSAAQIFQGSAQALSDHNRHLEELFVARNRELEELTSRARTDLTLTSAEIENALADNVKKVQDIFLISRDQLAETSTNVSTLLEARVNAFNETVRVTSYDLATANDALQTSLDEHRKAIGDAAAEARAAISTAGSEVAGDMDARTAAFSKAIAGSRDEVLNAAAHVESAIAHRTVALRDILNDSQTTLAQTSDQLAASFTEKTNEVCTAFENSRQLMAVVSDETVRTFSDRVENLRNSLTQVSDSTALVFSERVDSLRNSITEVSDASAATFTERADALRNSLIEVSDETTRSFTERVEALRQALAYVGDNTALTFTERVESLRQSLTDVSDMTTSVFTERTDTLRNALSNTTEETARAFTEQVEALRQSLMQVSGETAQTFSERVESLQQTLLSSQHAVTETSDQIAASMAENTEAARAALIQQQVQLNDAGEALIASLLENITAVREALHDSRGGFIEAGDEVAATIGARIEAVHATIQSGSRDLADAGEHIARLVETQTELARSTLSVTGQDLLDISTRVTAELSGHVSSTREEISAVHLEMSGQLETHRQFLREALGEHANAAGANFADATNEVISAMAVHSERVAESLSARFVDFKTGVVSLGDVLADQLADQSNRFSVDVNDKLASLEDTFTTHGAAFNEKLGDRTREAAAVFDKQVDEFERRTVLRTQDVSTSLETLVSRIETGLDSKIEDFEQRTAVRTMDVSTSLETLVNRIETGLDGKIGDFEQRTAVRTRDVATSLETLVNRIETGLDSKIEDFAQRSAIRTQDASQAIETLVSRIETGLDSRIEDFEQRTTMRTQDVTTSLESLVQRIDTGLEIRSKTFSESLATNALEIARSLGSGLQEVKGMLDPSALEEVLANNINGLSKTLSARIEELQKAVEAGVGSMDDRSAQITQAITEHARVIHETLDSASRIVNDNMGARASELHTLLDTTARNMTETLSSVSTTGAELSSEVVKLGEIVTNTIEGRASAIVDHLTEKQHQFTNAISATSNGLLEVAEVTSHTLREAIEQSASNSAHSLMTLGAQIESEFSSTLSKLETTGDALRRLITVTDQNLSNIDGSLSESVMKLQTALGSVSFQINTLNHTASNTVTGIDQLGDHMRGHNAELGQTLADLNRTQRELEESLEARRRSMYDLLASVDQKTGDIDNVMKAFNNLIEGSFLDAERRANEIGSLLARSSEDVVGTLNEKFALVRDETSKERELTLIAMRDAYESASHEVQQLFGDALSRFRASATEMRGVAQEIHHEINLAREEVQRGAADLPRESAEQAAAMRRVVSEQIKALSDLTEVVQRSGRNLDLAEPAPMPQTRVEPPRLEPQRTLDKPRMPRAEPPMPVAPVVADDASRLRSPAAASIRGMSPDRGPGWLSDLLARASQDEGDAGAVGSTLKPQARVAQSLDTISHDISRMVDHAAVVDAWDRYYRNERRAFSRRIYKGQGQQTFDEICRRYGADADFRETVDRYTQEFERVLTDVARDDRDGSLGRSYLISDQGKVYTMLAHAAGRIE